MNLYEDPLESKWTPKNKIWMNILKVGLPGGGVNISMFNLQQMKYFVYVKVVK